LKVGQDKAATYWSENRKNGTGLQNKMRMGFDIQLIEIVGNTSSAKEVPRESFPSEPLATLRHSDPLS
jgi:hypothetical protein